MEFDALNQNGFPASLSTSSHRQQQQQAQQQQQQWKRTTGTYKPISKSLSTLLCFLLLLRTGKSFQFLASASSNAQNPGHWAPSGIAPHQAAILAKSASSTPITNSKSGNSLVALKNYKLGTDTEQTIPLSLPKECALLDRNSSDYFKTQMEEYREYERRKKDWADRYTSLKTLRNTFGSNKNRLWGDLSGPTARRLYKTLLPKALLELAGLGVQPEDLAPLAYKARLAAKLYARYRSHVPSRILASLFDGFRTLKKYGRFQIRGMSYQQLWEKYQKAVVEDFHLESYEDPTDNELAVRQICLKILESSCRTNKNVDRWILRKSVDGVEREDLLQIAKTLEEDVRKLLNSDQNDDKPQPLRYYRIKRLLDRVQQQQQLQQQSQLPGNSSISDDDSTTTNQE